MPNIKIISIKKLRAHEKIDESNLKKVKKSILKINRLNNPVVVDKTNLIVLDGHHRIRALNDLGFKKIPVFLVDYMDKKIRVTSRRKNFAVNKKEIIKRALSGRLYPHKTSKHFIPLRPKSIKIELAKLH